MSRRVEAVDEVTVRLEVDGSTAACIGMTPEHLDAWAMGWLLTRGHIERTDGVAGIGVDATDAGAPMVRVRLAGDAGPAPAPECGPLAVLRRAGAPPRAGAAPLPPLERFADLFRTLYDEVELSRETGGLHVVALSDGARLRYATEDVARHVAVDKAIGRAILDGARMDALGLVASARISGEIALKAARSGLAWVASRSVPTTLAVAIAREAGFPIVARAAGKDARVFPEPAA